MMEQEDDPQDSLTVISAVVGVIGVGMFLAGAWGLGIIYYALMGLGGVLAFVSAVALGSSK